MGWADGFVEEGWGVTMTSRENGDFVTPKTDTLVRRIKSRSETDNQ